jgi:hypothetical protein
VDCAELSKDDAFVNRMILNLQDIEVGNSYQLSD